MGISIQNLQDVLGNAVTTTTVSTHQAMDVNVVASVGGAGGSTDNSAFTVSVSTFQPDGGVFNDSLAALSSGQQAMMRMTAYRAGHMNLRNNSGTEIGTTTTPLIATVQAALPAGANSIGTVVLGAGAASVGTVGLNAGSNSIGKVAQDNTTQWVTSDLADGPVAPGTAAGKSLLGGMVYNSSAPAPTTGQQLALQSDANGNLKTAFGGSLPAGTNSIGTVILGAGSAAIGSVTVTGTVAVSISAALPAGTNSIGKVAQDNSTQWITSDLADGPVSPGTAATKSLLGGAVYNSSAPTLTTGQQASLQADLNGNLKVALSGTSTVSVSNFPATQNVAVTAALPAGTNSIGTVILGAGSAAIGSVTVTGSVAVTNANDVSATPALTSVSVSTTSISVLASNAARKSFLIWNNGANPVFLAYGATATTSAFTFVIQPNSLFEPAKPYSGAISAIAGTGLSATLKVTELT